MIKMKIIPNDSTIVAKAVMIDADGRVLMLKRSDYVEKYAGQWDLPGGHIKVGERLEEGLKREVKEETDIDIDTSNIEFIQKIDNLNFYSCEYSDQPIKISNEHTGFRFFRKEDLNPANKFDKVALKALEIRND